MYLGEIGGYAWMLNFTLPFFCNFILRKFQVLQKALFLRLGSIRRDVVSVFQDATRSRALGLFWKF